MDPISSMFSQPSEISQHLYDAPEWKITNSLKRLCGQGFAKVHWNDRSQSTHCIFCPFPELDKSSTFGKRHIWTRWIYVQIDQTKSLWSFEIFGKLKPGTKAVGVTIITRMWGEWVLKNLGSLHVFMKWRLHVKCWLLIALPYQIL